MNNIYDEILIALHSVWNRRWLALAVAWGICLVGWLVVALIPNSYESSARIFVQMQSILPGKIGITPSEQQKDIDRIQQTLTSTVNLEKVVRGTDLSLSVSSPRELAAKVDMLQENIKIVAQRDNLFKITATSSDTGMSDAANAKMATAVVQKLIDIFVEENMAGDRHAPRPTLEFLHAHQAEREKQLRAPYQPQLDVEPQTNIKIVPQRDNLFKITATSSDTGMSDAANAKMATAVVQKLIYIFVEENMAGDRHETRQTLEFLDAQLAEREKQLRAAEQKRLDFEQQYLGQLPGTGSVSERMDAARQEMNDIESQLVQARSALAAMNGQLASTPSSLAMPGVNGGGNPYASAQAELAGAQARGWTDSHPDVIALKRQIANLKSLGTAGSGGDRKSTRLHSSP